MNRSFHTKVEVWLVSLATNHLTELLSWHEILMHPFYISESINSHNIHFPGFSYIIYASHPRTNYISENIHQEPTNNFSVDLLDITIKPNLLTSAIIKRDHEHGQIQAQTIRNQRTVLYWMRSTDITVGDKEISSFIWPIWF